MRDDMLKEQLMGYARTAADEAAQPDAAAIRRRARRHYRRVAALAVAGVLLVVGLGVSLGLGRDHTTPTVNRPLPTVNQPPPTPTRPNPGPVPSTATTPATGKLPATFVGDLGGRVAVVSTSSGKVVRTLFGSQPPGSPGYGVGITPDRSTVYFSLEGPEGCNQRGIFRVPSGGGRPVRVVADDNAGGLIRFSADGSRMAYTSLPCPDTGEHGDIVVREADGTLVRRWKTPSYDSRISVGQVSLSPDGRSVAVPTVHILDAVGVQVLDVARTDAFDDGRLVKTTDPGCTLVAADFQPRSGHLAAFEGCRPGGGLTGSPSRYRLVYLDPASGDVRSRAFSFVNTGGDLHVPTMDFDAGGRHLLYTVTSGTPTDGTGTWRSSDGGRPVRVHDDRTMKNGQISEHVTTGSPSW
jgi:hypothetical protein